MEERPWFKHYDKGVPHTLKYPDGPVFQFLEDTAKKYPDTPCTIFKGAVITYKEMNAITDQIAGALAGLGVKKGDRVGLFMPNTPQFIEAFFGILKAGGIVVAANTMYTPPEIEHQMNDAGVEIMMVMSNFYEKMKIAQPKTKIKTLIVTNIKEALPPALRVLFTLLKEKKGGFRIKLQPGDYWLPELLAKYPPESRPTVAIKSSDPAIFQYSGGTTGVPKAAIGTHRNLVANPLMMRAWMVECKDGEETTLMAIPLFHVYGMVAGMLLSTVIGSRMVMVPNPRDMEDVFTNIVKFRPSIYPGVPAMYNSINNHPDVIAGKYDLTSIRYCISGSAPLMRDTKERFEALTGGKLCEGYGLSETPTATHCNPLLGENRTGSIGIPLPDVDARIVDLDDGVTEMPIGEIGEIIINSPHVMKGYHNMPTETKNALRKLKDGSGPWLYTGDIARMDEDGYFYIVDRKKELIKPGGFQVWPREVEEAICAHPKVLEAGVAGIPDPHRGETVKAWVVCKPGETLSEADVKAWCKERLAPYKVPTQVEFRTELPRTTVGKILRRELVKQEKEK